MKAHFPHKIKVVVDAKGVVEVAGISKGEDQARQLAEDLGLGAYTPVNFMHTVIRSQPLDPARVEAVKAKAAELEYEVGEVDDIAVLHPPQPAVEAKALEAGGHTGTIAALHEHSLGPSRREKLILPLVLAGVILVALAVGGVVRDHLGASYDRTVTLAEMVALGNQPPVEQNALSRLINPDDSRYVSVPIDSWPFWRGKSAIAQDHYLRLPGLLEPSLETLVKGERGAAVLVLRVDVASRHGDVYRVNEIYRGGLPSGNEDLDLEVIPLRTRPVPPVLSDQRENQYVDGSNIRYDRDRTFRDLDLFAVAAFAIRTGDSVMLRGDGFNVALADGLSPAIVALIEDTAVTSEQMDRLLANGMEPEERVDVNRRKFTWFLQLEETFPWAEDGRPARRQVTREIGRARLVGVKLRNVYVVNDPA